MYCPRCGLPLDTAHRCGTDWTPVAAGTGSVRAALLTYFALLAVCLCGWAVALNSHHEASDGSLFRFDLWLTVAFACVSGTAALACCKRLWPLVTAPVPRRWWLLAACLPIATFTLATLCVTAVRLVLGLPLGGADYFMGAGVSLWVQLAIVAVQPAVFEELAFRGVVLDGLRGSLSTREAVIVSAVLFTILHLQFFGVVHLLAIGLVLGWLRVRTGSLLPGMVVHFGHNSLCVLYDRLIGA